MCLRKLAVVGAFMLITPAFAQDLTPEQATQFILGKKWFFTCVDGTKGSGTFNRNGSATTDFRSRGITNTRKFPAGSIHPGSGSLCMPAIFGLDVCFKVHKIDTEHWVGSSAFVLTSWFKCDFVAER